MVLGMTPAEALIGRELNHHPSAAAQHGRCFVPGHPLRPTRFVYDSHRFHGLASRAFDMHACVHYALRTGKDRFEPTVEVEGGGG